MSERPNPGVPDWWYNRVFAVVAVLAAGYCADTGWLSCALAWLSVSIGLIFWSISENEMRP